MGQQMERRQHERFTVVDLVLYEQATNRPIGKVVNVSARGLLVISSKEYKVGKEIDFFIPFTKTVQGLVKFEFKGAVKWSTQSDENPAQMKIGMEFADNPDLQTMFIQQLVKVYGAS